MKSLPSFFSIVQSALLRPSTKQLEAYARILHTLTSASFIGAITLPFTEVSKSDAYLWIKLCALLSGGIISLVLGALLLTGEKS